MWWWYYENNAQIKRCRELSTKHINGIVLRKEARVIKIWLVESKVVYNHI